MSSVHVSNISSSTSADDVKAFLSFCGISSSSFVSKMKANENQGKISSLNMHDAADGTKSATVVFEKESASKTALLLDRTSLGSNEIHVSASKDGSGATSTGSALHHDDGSDELQQEDKPR